MSGFPREREEQIAPFPMRLQVFKSPPSSPPPPPQEKGALTLRHSCRLQALTHLARGFAISNRSLFDLGGTGIPPIAAKDGGREA